jgi:hypothetical protein
MALGCLTINPRVAVDIDLGDKQWFFSVVEDMCWLDPANDQRRNYVFAADTEAEMTEWITLLQSAKKGVHQRAASTPPSTAAKPATSSPDPLTLPVIPPGTPPPAKDQSTASSAAVPLAGSAASTTPQAAAASEIPQTRETRSGTEW